jgi:DNA helicase II / ATP-dependent DNA helicase PcrA
MSKQWSSYQQAIFAFVEDPTKGNAVVQAVAGSGKTTTIVECNVRVTHQGRSAVFLAFNKAIAEELKSRGVNARTFHSVTYNPVTKLKCTNNVETNKLRTLTKRNMTIQEDFMYGNFCAKLVGLARQSGIGCLVPDVEKEWWDIVDHHNLELENEKATLERAVELARDLLVWSNESTMIDFDDLLYFAILNDVVLPKFDFIFVDETQDTNAIQRAILVKMMKPTTRIIGVGDKAQSIYGFRGADSNSLQLFAEQFNCVELPLTISYRCSQAVIAHAHKWVKHIEAAEGAPEGSVVNLGTEWDHTVFRPTDLVVCRTTKPLVSLAYKLMKARVPVKIMGREIGQGLKSLISKMKCPGVDDLIVKLEEWASREIDKAIVKNLDAKVEAIQDKSDCIICLIDSLPEDERTIPHLEAVIEMLFANTPGVNTCTLASIHKAKGMEADHVFWLNSSQCPAKWAKKEWQKEQERNLCYVATTRAMTSLILIEDGSGKKSLKGSELPSELKQEIKAVDAIIHGE